MQETAKQCSPTISVYVSDPGCRYDLIVSSDRLLCFRRGVAENISETGRCSSIKSGSSEEESPKYSSAMDDITHIQIRGLLEHGISLLSPIQRAIVTSFYFVEKPATQKHFLAAHAINKQHMDAERGTALSSLKLWMASHGLTRMRDIE
jgi:hypothetical protein